MYNHSKYNFYRIRNCRNYKKIQFWFLFNSVKKFVLHIIILLDKKLLQSSKFFQTSHNFYKTDWDQTYHKGKQKTQVAEYFRLNKFSLILFNKVEIRRASFRFDYRLKGRTFKDYVSHIWSVFIVLEQKKPYQYASLNIWMTILGLRQNTKT